MSEEKKLITTVVRELEENLELFYQQKNAEALVGFDEVLVKVTTAVDYIFRYKESHSEFQFDEKKLADLLKEAMDALEERDFILMADILQYDFIEYVNELAEIME